MLVDEEPQLMEGGDAPSGSFKWTIEGFSKLTKKKYSEIFYLGGVGWRLLIFPKGNNVDYLSIYLDAADFDTTSQDGWSIDAQCSIMVENHFQYKLKLTKDTQHQFNARESDWGFTRFMPLTDLHDPDKGFLVNDTCIIEAIVAVKSVVPPKKTKTPSVTQSLEQKKNSLDFFIKPPRKKNGSSAPRVLHIDLTKSNKVAQSEDSPSKDEGSSAPSVLLIDTTDSSKVTESEEHPKNSDVSSNEKCPANGHVVIEKQTRSLPTLFCRLGSLKVRTPPYSLPNGFRITEEAVLDEGDMAAQLIQSALLSSELQPLVEMPAVDLANQSYYHLAKFLHYHCASMVSTQGLQDKHQEHANALEEIKRRDVEIDKLKLALEKSAQEASQLREDLEKAKEENAKVVDEFSAAIKNIINLEGDLQLLRSENIDLQIQLEDARQAEQKVTQASLTNDADIAA